MSPTRILFIGEGQLGDLLVLTPAIRAIKRTFPNASIAVLIFQRRGYFRNTGSDSYFSDHPQSRAAAVFSTNPYVDAIMEVDLEALRQLGWLSRAKAELDILAQLRKRHFDTVIVFPRDRFVLWAYISGARIRVGQKQQVYHQLLTHTPDIHKRDEGVIAYYCRLAAAIGATVKSYNTEFFVTDSARRSVSAFLHTHGLPASAKLIAVHPGASAPDRIWPLESYAAFIDRVQSTTGYRALLCGSTFDKSVVDKIAALSSTNPLLVDTGDELVFFAALLERCALFVGNNSGPRHLAAAVGTRTLAFLTRNDELEWEAYNDKRWHAILQWEGPCDHCSDGECSKKIPKGTEYGSYCMRMISIDQTILKMEEMLRE